MAEPLIRMEAVAVSAMRDPSTIVAEDIDWTVSPGDYWVLAGSHGSGKSDFLAMTGGLIAPARGRYRLFGEEMPIFEGARLSLRLRLGLVFDGGQLLNHLTVAENVALPLRYHGNLSAAAAEPAVTAMLECLELTPWAHSTPGAIGRSWQKRAGLARALMLKPEVLALDNPLGGLDLRHADWCLGFLDELSKGHPLLEGRPVTLAVTAADLGPWQGRTTHLAVFKDRHLLVLGAWAAVAEANRELLHEVLAETK